MPITFRYSELIRMQIFMAGMTCDWNKASRATKDFYEFYPAYFNVEVFNSGVRLCI